MSATIKRDGKDASWLVFHGTPAEISRDIKDVFGIDGEGLTIAELVGEAEAMWKSSGNVASGLGGRSLPSGDRTSGSGTTAPPWNRDAAAPTEPQEDPNVVRLTAEIEAATDRASLKDMFARNKTVFDANSALTDAWRAKGKSLPA